MLKRLYFAIYIRNVIMGAISLGYKNLETISGLFVLIHIVIYSKTQRHMINKLLILFNIQPSFQPPLQTIEYTLDLFSKAYAYVPA